MTTLACFATTAGADEPADKAKVAAGATIAAALRHEAVAGEPQDEAALAGVELHAPVLREGDDDHVRGIPLSACAGTRRGVAEEDDYR